MSGFEQVSRRIFIRDFGRGVLGISIGTGLLAACTPDPAAETPAASPVPSSTTTAGAPATTTSAPTTSTTEATTTTTESLPPASTIAQIDPLSVERMALGNTTAYLMVRGTAVALVDTGGGGRIGDIEEALATIGLGWDAMGTVILTHRHGDHVGSLAAVMRELSDPIVGAGEGDLGSISGADTIQAFADGDTVFGSTIVSTPGHTAGHIAVWDETTRVLIAGDALNGGGSGVRAVDGVAGPNPNFTQDMQAAIDSARKLATLQPETIFFGHGTPKREGAATALQALVDGF